MNIRSVSHQRDRTLHVEHEAHRLSFVLSNAPLAWAGVGVSGLALAGLVVWERIPLMLAAGCSLAVAAVVVLATMGNRPKILFLFFLNSCLLVVAQRDAGGIDFIVLLSLLTALLTGFGLASIKHARDTTLGPVLGDSYFGAVQYTLVGFAVLSVISTISNSQSIISLLSWVNGLTFAFLTCRAQASQLPSFSTARRAILVGGALAVTYDLYLLSTGRALNVGTFNSGRFVGSLGDYELLAEFYGALILLCLTAIFFDDSRRWRVASYVLIVPSFVILFATQSRGPIVILCAVAPILALISAFQFRESAGKILAIFGGLAVVVFISIGTLSATPLFERLSSIQLEGSIESTLNRAGVWDYFTQLPRFVDSGLTGNGFDYPYEEIGTYPHSLYLWLLWSGGILILVCFGLLISLILCKLLRGIFVRQSASLSAAAIILYILLDEIKIEAARTSPSVCFLWVVLSLTILASREQREL